MSFKVSFIGAGSVVFSKRLASDLLQFREFDDITLCLMDIDPERLRVAETVTRRIAEKLGVKARIEATLDRKKAIRGARYVITMIQVGGYDPGTVIDFEIPRRYGLKQTVADTLGIGGIFRALRTIPVLLDIAREIEDLGAPGCMLINYSNPMAMNCWAVYETSPIPVVGLCHSVFGTAHMLARLVGVPTDEVEYLVAGINHMAFFLQYTHRGQDLYPALFRLIEDPEWPHDKVRFEMMRRTGYFVTESSAHQSEYIPYFIHHGDEMISKFDIPIDLYMKRCEAIQERWKEIQANLLDSRKEAEIEPQSYEYGTYIIHSRETGMPRTVYANVRNSGSITNLPDACCVEVPCLVDRTGLHPVQIGDLPPQLAAICQTNINVQQLTVEAALTGKREHVYHAAMLDPHTSATLPLDKIWALCDDLFEAHEKQGYLPGYSATVPNTGRSLKGTGDVVQARLSVPNGFENKAGAESILDVTACNPENKKTTIKVQLDISCDAIAAKGKDTLTLSIPAKGSAAGKFTVVCRKPIEKSHFIALKSLTPGVLAIGESVFPRQTLALGKEAHTFDLKLHKLPAAEGTLSRVKDAFQLDITVNDTHIRPAEPVNPALGSSVELIFSPTTSTVDVVHLVLIASPGKTGKAKAWHASGREEAKIKISQKVTKTHYSLSATIPDSVVKNQWRNKRCLFNLAVNVHALGGAHDGGKIVLNDARSAYDPATWMIIEG